MDVKGVLRNFVFIALFAAVTVGNAAAQTTGAMTGSQLKQALSQAGFSADIVKDKKSDKLVLKGTTKLSGGQKINFIVRKRDCKGKPLACETLVFFANFNLGREIKPADFKTLNRFNDTQVFGRAYTLEKEKQVGVDYVLQLGGGVSQKYLARSMKRWPGIIQSFIDSFKKQNTKKKK